MPSTSPILVVDDQPSETYFVRRALKAAGLSNPVIGCGDRGEAVAFLESAKFGGQQPCLVLLDLSMPRINGFAFLAWIRSQPELSQLKIVVLTNSSRDDDRDRAAALGAHDYLVKFPRADTLAATVATALTAAERNVEQQGHQPPPQNRRASNRASARVQAMARHESPARS